MPRRRIAPLPIRRLPKIRAVLARAAALLLPAQSGARLGARSGALVPSAARKRRFLGIGWVIRRRRSPTRVRPRPTCWA